jgi:hypothetical protein
MSSHNPVEHFVTLFDSNFLPMGMALHESLSAHGQPFHLWILCMDELVEEQLKRISLPNVTLMPLRKAETQEMLSVKGERNRAEYCWTLTPFTYQMVFDSDQNIQRVTYVDADLYFFDSPRVLLDELDASGKHVLITEHAYAPEYSRGQAVNGRFCVQFLTFRRTPQALKVMRWWQERCIEWCFDRNEDGKFGDQKYLDSWPELFGNEVAIVQQTDKTLAPWNVNYLENKLQGRLAPVFYHFHGIRITGPDRVQLYRFYNIGMQGLLLYDLYFKALQKSFATLKALGMPVPYRRESVYLRTRIWQKILRREGHRRY